MTTISDLVRRHGGTYEGQLLQATFRDTATVERLVRSRSNAPTHR